MAWQLNLDATDSAFCMLRPKYTRAFIVMYSLLVQGHRVVPAWVYQTPALKPIASILDGCSIRSGKWVGIRAEFKFSKCPCLEEGS
eukprot:scaffold44688_cov15-Tisochrysis_lutea.AAC.1